MYSIKILAEFEFVVDLDLAMYKYIRENANNPSYVDQDFIHCENEKKVIQTFLDRDVVNPLSCIIPSVKTDSLYEELKTSKLKDILEYAKAYDTFGLLITFTKETKYTSVTILCDNALQEKFIHKLNPNMNTIVVKNRKAVPLGSYDVIYMKYYANALLYDIQSLNGKHIYISNARYNVEEKSGLPLIAISVIVSDLNIIHFMDQYTKVKFFNEALYKKEKKESQEDKKNG